MKRIFNRYILPLIVIAGGVLMLVLYISNAVDSTKFIEATGTISSIDVVRRSSDKKEYVVNVDYTYEGQTYKSELGEYRATFSVGDEVGIKINPEDPTEIQSDSIMMHIISIAFAVFTLFVGVFMLFKSLTRR